MRLSEGVEWAAHCVVMLAGMPPGKGLSAARLAEYHDVPAPYLAKALQTLARAAIVGSRPGRGGGYHLVRDPAELTLLDVVEAIDGPGPLFSCTEIRKRGPARVAPREYRHTCGVHAAMQRAEAAWRQELAATTIAALAAGVRRDAPAEALQRTIAWLDATG